MKKTKEKQATRREDATTSNGFNYLPPSPPAQQKTPPQDLLQPASPSLQTSYPLLPNDHNNECQSIDEVNSMDHRDCLALEDFESFIAQTTTLPSPNTNSYILSMSMDLYDFPIAPLLNGSNEDFDIDQDTMSINSTDYALFPSLPDNTGG
ncbi:hypothetical protein BD560DRAFT_396129 [Blakeslea trispora]|nr:hypothetical protein BD560DRAFT_396129 [Blakeslea trispora]